MPKHWLPYTVAEYFTFDHRTVTFVIFFATAFYVSFTSFLKLGIQRSLPTLSLLFVTYIAISFYGGGSAVGITVEIMVGCYYLLFIRNLSHKNVWLTALFISFCMLSRYYIMHWLSLYLFVMAVSGAQKQLFRVLLGIFVVVMLQYIIPFLSKDWSSFYVAYKNNYEVVPIGEWHRLDAQGRPEHLVSDLSYTFLFYTDLSDGEIMQ